MSRLEIPEPITQKPEKLKIKALPYTLLVPADAGREAQKPER